MIIDPRGTGGAGKTELVRHILTEYGWERDGRYDVGSDIAVICREGRGRPFRYRLWHPRGRRPLAVPGHYERTSGGCDTITVQDGGLAEIMRRVGGYAVSGHDVVIKGLRLRSEVEFFIDLERSHGLHILYLGTLLGRCVRNLMSPAVVRAGTRCRSSRGTRRPSTGGWRRRANAFGRTRRSRS
ncbi:hypothetical protein [Microvirga sp. KLBC 81]|uniref:hypothetical protein n=1 Tax=Microvirga sp. KLBC 81 TaxID=1862707 RepID=UPI0010579048|nr:hypothetical protein [Microvirga sp. KLBC 81]